MIIRNKYRRQYVRRWCADAGVEYSRKVWFVRRQAARERNKR